MSNLSPATVGYFKTAGVFRVKSDKKARERFDEALSDYMDDVFCDVTIANDEDADALFAALLQHRDEEKAARLAKQIEREERRAAKEEAEKAKPITGGLSSATGHIRDLPPGRYVLTSAQNNTDVDADEMASLHQFCKRMNAQLLIGRMTYNKSAFRQPDVDATDGVFYDNAVVPYLVNGTLNLGDKFYFVADANVIPTAKHPTSSFDAASPAGVGVIIPATKIELRMAAALKGGEARPIMSTGTVTKRNYIMRKAGAVASLGHNIGALFVDTETGDFRQLEQMEGETGFYDVDGFYSPNGFRPLSQGDVAAYQPGDIHAEKADPDVYSGALLAIERFQPKNILVHDLLDFSSRNHHNIKDPFFLTDQTKKGHTVRDDFRQAANALLDISDACKNAVVHVIVSNHDQAADKWLEETDWKDDPVNAKTYLELALERVKHGGDPGYNTLETACNMYGPRPVPWQVRFAVLDESIPIAGVEMGNHGHNGANGARGNPKAFGNLGVPINTGHTHSPSIYGGCYTAGIRASLTMGYNVGASSWAVADTITYDNGQRQILFG